MENILFVTDLHIGAQIQKAAGVFARARHYGWRVMEIERERTSRPLSEFVRTWKPTGCIIDCSGMERSPRGVPNDTPAVLLDPDPSTVARPCNAVVSDSDAIAALAVEELLNAKCASFAYAGWRSRTGWSQARGASFAAQLKAKGFGCALTDEPWTEELEMQRRIAARLGAMERRVGILAANDYVAKQVVSAVALAGMECPRDAVVVGVDDDELICEGQVPTISSIGTDFEKAGRLATDLLASIVRNPGQGKSLLKFGPTVLHRRQSSRVVNTNDWRIARAVERIRRDACDGLAASDVIAETGLSRRLVERRFLEATGRTILGEIVEVRFGQACRLLRDQSIPIGEIAYLCGWKSDSYLKRLFKARTGMTPREWRKSL